MYLGYELKVLLTKMRKEVEFVNEQIRRMPAGRLLITKRGDRKDFFQEFYTEGKRFRKSITKNNVFIAKLARKKYLETKKDLLEQNIDLFEKLQKNYIEVNPENIINRLPERFKTLPMELFFEPFSKPFSEPFIEPVSEHFSDSSDPPSWSTEPYEKSMFMPEAKVHTTSRGLKVRSKSELLIAEKLYEYGVEFRYEQILHIGKSILAPDFTIKRKDGKIFLSGTLRQNK